MIDCRNTQAVLEQAGFSVLSATYDAKKDYKWPGSGTRIWSSRKSCWKKPDAGFVLGYQHESDPTLAQVPLVLLSSVFQRTGTVFDLNSPQARQWIKADAYLERPVAPERLIAKLRGLLLHPNAVHS